MDTLEQSLDTLKWMEKVVGNTNTLTIDSNIYKHAEILDDDHLLNMDDDLYIIKATVENPITLTDLIIIFTKIQNQFKKVRDMGRSYRSYYYEGFVYENNNITNSLDIQWDRNLIF